MIGEFGGENGDCSVSQNVEFLKLILNEIGRSEKNGLNLMMSIQTD